MLLSSILSNQLLSIVVASISDILLSINLKLTPPQDQLENSIYSRKTTEVLTRHWITVINFTGIYSDILIHIPR